MASFLVALVAACEDPQSPAMCGAIPQVTVNAGETSTVTACFNDPNGDMLTYSATSSNPSVATVSNSGATITITAVAPGNASVTVTATDVGGLQGQSSFQVSVPNRAPLPRGTIPSMTIAAGETVSVDASQYFSEPDGETLVYSAASSDPAIATVSVTGSSVAVTGTAKGTTTVAVMATDPGGLSATQSFPATVPNRPPVPVGTMPDETVEADDAITVDLPSYFQDPDGDDLRYTARSSASGVVRTSVAGDILTVTGIAKGTADVTVTATDTDDLSATQTFQVTVPNRRPTPVSTIPQQTLETGGSTTFGVSRYFTDPDGDALTYSATSSNTSVASVSVSGSNVTITAGQAGSATVTVTARDPDGLTATQRASVSVSQSNRAPQPVGTIPAQTLDPGGSVPINVSQYFTDPDGDALTYTATSSNTTVATVSVSGSTVTITAVGAGSATITITARDPDGLFAIQRVGVTVTQSNRPPRAAGTVPTQNLSPGGSVTINAALYFTDPDGDPLTYTATTSNANVARASVSGSAVTIRALAAGRATITITATDPGGLSATQQVTVRVIAEPDLLFTRVAPRAITVAPNDTFTVQFTVRNSGGATSAATTMRFYESNDASISTGDIQLGTTPFAALAASASRTVTTDFTVAATASGTLYLGSCVDPVSGESETGNNCSPSIRVTITSGLTRLTNHPARDWSPAWSPDGRRIAFETNRTGDLDVYVMNADGSGAARLTGNSADDVDPAWSANGSEIAFSSDRDGNEEIYVMNADGSGVTRLTNNSRPDRSPAWSPDGRRIAFGSRTNFNIDVYVMNADGSGATNLTNNSANNDYNAAWSPDGCQNSFHIQSRR